MKSQKVINASKENLVNAHVVAELLGLSYRTVQDMASRRELPLYKIRGRICFKPSEVIEWREQFKIDPKQSFNLAGRAS